MTSRIQTLQSAIGTPQATRREWMGLAVISLPCMLYSMDLTVLNLALPRLSADLRPSSAELLWIVDIYGFLLAGSLSTMGTLGDRIGRRRLLLIGAAAFGVASVLAALSTSPAMLIATRALLGIAGATLAPSTLSLIRNMFLDQRQRTTAIGIWVSSYSIGAAIGPLLGGLLLERFWWGSVFLVGVPVMALLLMAGPVFLPEFRDPAAGRLDLASVSLSLTSVLSIIDGLKRIARRRTGMVACLVHHRGIAIGGVFVRKQLNAADPLIDLRLFRAPAFSASLATYLLGTFVSFGAYVFIGQYLQLVVGLSPLQAGLWTLPWPMAFILGSMLTPALARRVRVESIMAAGLVASAVGFAILTRVDGVFGLTAIVIGSSVMSLGLAPVFILATDVIVGAAPPEQAGAASALSETSSEFGGALGIAVLGSIGTAVYRSQLVVPGEVPEEAAAAARDTLGGAVAAAVGLPQAVAAELLLTARTAFEQSFELAAGISAAIALTSGLAVAFLRRRASPATASASEA